LALSSPAYFTFTAMLTPILGISDGVMRFVPALFGILLVLLPWLLRDRLSTVGALITAVFLTISPIATALSRTAGGDSIALFAAFLLLIAWVNGRDSGNGRWFYLFTIALALGLTSSPLFYSALATLGIAWLGQRLAGPRLIAENEENTKLEPATLRSGLIVGGILFLLISTFYLLSVGNVGAAAAILGDWLHQFGGFGNLDNALAPFLAIVRYEIALLVVGLIAIIWAAWRLQSLPMFCVYWLVGTLLLLILQQGNLINAALIILPLYLLIGAFAGAIIGQHIGWHGWLLTVGLLILWALMFVNTSRFLRKMTFGGDDFNNAWIVIFALAFALTVIFFAISWDARATYQAVVISVLLMLLFYNWGTAWWLGHEAANDPRENWVNDGTDAGMLVLADVVQDLSWQLSKSDQDVDILSTVDTPALRWYLRDYVNATIGKAAPSDTTSTLVITPANAQTALGTSYMGADYIISRSAPVEEVISNSPTLDTLRWWVFHQSPAVPAQERVILWVKSETAP
ncbi:MAG: glycosyltransferase family 39 protein, partial [Anaerolineae bacterium]|nr:glycosyltransferase family 39 protein [Anaerolineae bacterium]